MEGGLGEEGGRSRMRLQRWLGLNPAEASLLEEEHWLGEEAEVLWKRGG